MPGTHKSFRMLLKLQGAHETFKLENTAPWKLLGFKVAGKFTFFPLSRVWVRVAMLVTWTMDFCKLF